KAVPRRAARAVLLQNLAPRFLRELVEVPCKRSGLVRLSEDLAERLADVGRCEEAEVVFRSERAGQEHLRIDALPRISCRLLIRLDDALLRAVEGPDDCSVHISARADSPPRRKGRLGGQLREELRVVREALRERRDPSDGVWPNRHLRGL